MKSRYFLFLAVSLATFACNQDQSQTPNATPSGTSENSGLAISNVALTQTNGTGPFSFLLYFQPVQSNAKLSDLCPSTATNCYCQFSWTATNPFNLSSQGGAETVNAPLNILDSQSATCSIGSTFYFPDYTKIQISVVSYASNSNASTTVGPYSYVSFPSVQAGDYDDSSGRPYMDIIQYDCSRTDLASSSDNSLSLYIPESFLGDIISSNDAFQCAAPTSNGVAAKKFSLALSPYWLFPIQVQAGILLSETGSAQNDEIYPGSLGYAAAPNSDGTCPSFELSSGSMMKTYPLRKFEPLEQWKTSIYVLDQDGTQTAPPQGYNTDYTFQACAPASV